MYLSCNVVFLSFIVVYQSWSLVHWFCSIVHEFGYVWMFGCLVMFEYVLYTILWMLCTHLALLIFHNLCLLHCSIYTLFICKSNQSINQSINQSNVLIRNVAYQLCYNKVCHKFGKNIIAYEPCIRQYSKMKFIIRPPN